MLELLNLPDIVLEKILSYLTYDDIARYRIICRQFDTLCKQLLNKGFILVEKHHRHCLKAVKSQLPRRESERRCHPLARHCDILTAIETRLSILAMTFTKYIDAGLCCFIPGKVIDEIFRVLRRLKDSETPRAHEVLQELRDISSMAMEHFDEKIVPLLKHNLTSSSAHTSYSMTGSCLMSGASTPRILGQEKLRIEFSKIHSRTKQNKASVGCLKRTVGNLTLKLKRHSAQLMVQSAKIVQQQAKLTEQDAKLAEQANKLTEQDTQIAELKRHLEEWDHKFADLTAELSRAREESGAITEAGTSHEVEGRVARNMLPVGSAEAEGRVSRRKLRTSTVISSDVTAPGQEEDRDRSAMMKRKAEPDNFKIDLAKKSKVQPSDEVAK
jgi:F-box protein 28